MEGRERESKRVMRDQRVRNGKTEELREEGREEGGRRKGGKMAFLCYLQCDLL